MMKALQINTLVIFLVLLGIYMGAGIFNTLLDNYTWYTDPLSYIDHILKNSYAGIFNPWPLLTALLFLSTLISLIVFAKYNGEGKRHIRYVLFGTLLMLIATLAYFVPQLFSIFDPLNTDNAIRIRASRRWVILNVLRQVFIVVLFVGALRFVLRADHHNKREY